MTAPTPGAFPAEPLDAGSSTPRASAPIWTTDYDLTAQPNQAASEPPTPPATARGAEREPARRQPAREPARPATRRAREEEEPSTDHSLSEQTFPVKEYPIEVDVEPTPPRRGPGRGGGKRY